MNGTLDELQKSFWMEVVVHNTALISSGFLFLHLHYLNKHMEHKGLHAVK